MTTDTCIRVSKLESIFSNSSCQTMGEIIIGHINYYLIIIFVSELIVI